MNFQVTSNIPSVISKLERAQREFTNDLRKTLNTQMINAEKISKQEFLNGPRPTRLGVISGTLIRSVRGRVEKKGDSYVGTLSASTPYASAHEWGAMVGKGRKVKLPARPYLQPALQRIIEPLKASLKKLFDRWSI